ncbi:winged helix-turn-helix transcriptional regulator [Arenicella xantha]|uniref:Winged helix-turn-helix DNA-binding protein n=1 Tax=Arenicella xantha TaxID=644221 RepID=A0A395JHU2_9GAMM|nr:winged helix-turn-helix transcriptional regulator [Arenicella xantha]RBP48453.1 winged helix-turn-helix DNA-binding protein [Arenicella xantha]
MNTRQSQTSSDKENQLTLELLKAIEQKDDISQRHLAQEMGVALGLANSYLKRCVKKGWIKITTAPANRYLYYVTPNGFAEKARLTAEFFSTSLALFRQSGDEYSQVYNRCREAGHGRVVLAGLSDLTEIALMRGLQAKIDVVAILQPDAQRDDFFNVAVSQVLPDKQTFDCVVLTSMEQTSDLLVALESQLDDQPIYVPDMLLNMNYRNTESNVDVSNIDASNDLQQTS